MKSRTPKSFLKIATVLGLGLALSGCTADTPTESVTLEDLFGQLQIEMSSVAGTNSVTSNSGLAFKAPAAALTEPSLNEIIVPAPGTAQVFQWPEVIDLDIRPRFEGHDTVLSWPRVNWPAFDILSPEHRYFGHSGLVYYSRSRGAWYAIATEWLRDARERSGVRYPYEEKFVEGRIQNGDPIGYFIAGPWRHQKNDPAFQRRSRIKWFTWPSLQPLAWGGGSGGPGPRGEKTIEEMHVYIVGIKTQLAGGPVVDFSENVGLDVDLLALRGTTIPVVNTDVPPGTYEYVNFSVDPGRSFLVVDGDKVELEVNLQDIRVDGPFTVEAGVPTTVTIEFDPDGSLKENADGSYTLKVVAVLHVGGK